MEQVFLTVTENVALTKDVYRMVLQGDTKAITASGQFVNLKIDGTYLRRPISVCDYTDTSVTLLYKVVGKGTRIMAQMPNGTVIDTLTGLGNGYNIEKSGDTPALIGGGVGIPPLYRLCKDLIAQGKHPTVILGFRSKADIFYQSEFEALGATVLVATEDGSAGIKGFVTDALQTVDYSYFYTCGPEPMFRAIEKIVKTSGQYSFEERMGCGFGACMGCSCKTLYGNKRICVDGPVLEREEIIWTQK